MPPLDLELADECIRSASDLIGRRLPASYPPDPAGAYRERRGGPRSGGVVELVAGAAEELLRQAVAREADARRAQELAIRALRNLGGYGCAWPAIAELVGLSPQGAHKRYRAIADAPRPQLTIADELEPATP